MTEQPFRFGTVGSPYSTPKKPGGSVGAVLHIKALGLSALELGWVNAVRVTEATCAQIRQTAAEQEVALSVHAPYFINLNADVEEWPKSRKRLMDAAFYGHLAGATEIVFHPGSYFQRPPEAVLPIAIERLQGCVDELQQAGNPVRLRPETMGKSAMLGSLEDALQLGRAIPGIEPCIDFAHLHARPGDGSMNTYEEWSHALEAYAQALGSDALQRMHIHLSGIAYGPKGEKAHLPLQEADIDPQAIFRALRGFGCAGRILCEGPEEALEGDALKLKQIWQELP
jgi:deoxyribonuclease-4